MLMLLILLCIATVLALPGNESYSNYCVFQVSRTGAAESEASPNCTNLPHAVGKCVLNGNEKKCGPIMRTEYSAGSLVLEMNPDAKLCGAGTLLPMFESELLWNRWTRLFLYAIALVYCFMGIAIVSDVFMAAIEVIASKEKTIVVEEFGVKQEVKVLVWNATVANLSLMALGSSAPEILLAVVETCGQLNQPPPEGGLGPSTIVGSAAFNLLAITAVCVSSIPNNDDGTPGVRRIKEMGVFLVTAFFSIFAYLWMYFVVSDNVVTLAEALITLGFFPLLLCLAYGAEKGLFGGTKTKVDPQGQKFFPANGGSAMSSTLARYLNSNQTTAALEEGNIDDLVHQLANQMMQDAPQSRMRYRINATRFMKGGRSVKMQPGKKMLEKTDNQSSTKHLIGGSRQFTAQSANHTTSKILLGASAYAVNESSQRVEIQIVRTGFLNHHQCVRWETRDGTAIAGDDYEQCSGIVHFAAVTDGAAQHGTETRTITIPIVDDDLYEPDEVFYVDLKKVDLATAGKLLRRQAADTTKPSVEPVDKDLIDFESITYTDYEFGPHQTAEITIINDDCPGEFEFEQKEHVVVAGSADVAISIVRKNGCDGTIQLNLKTIASTAREHEDFVPESKIITFEHNEVSQTVKLRLVEQTIIPSEFTEKAFSVVLSLTSTENGSKLGECQRTIVKLVENEKYSQAVNNLAEQLANEMQQYRLDTSTWGEQFRAAMQCGDGEEVEDASTYILHFLSIGWKVLFACIPPTDYVGGWLTFVVSLAFIALLTSIVADVAKTFGCLMGLTDAVTAITFVALGTSLPDLFASRTAAGQDPYADASIGNVTGSNSVNVFLGLGLPWCIATIIHSVNSYDGGVYRVEAGSLAFTIAVFCPCALGCLGLLFFRRITCGAELGGPKKLATISSMVLASLWFVYILMSSLESMGIIKSPL